MTDRLTDKRPWYEFDPDAESLNECMDRRLMRMPVLSGAEMEVFRKCRTATWDGNIPSKIARDQLARKGLLVRYNGWQVVTKEGLAVLDTLKELKP